MIRRPPRSTLFPTRRSSDLLRWCGAKRERWYARAMGDRSAAARPMVDTHCHLDSLDFVRSEEHTSELQSRLHLVCRLLLEKKKIHSRTEQTRDIMTMCGNTE